MQVDNNQLQKNHGRHQIMILYIKDIYAPPFRVISMDGKVITNESCKGKVTFISFWFEGCTGCRAEFAEMNELYDSLKNDTS